MSSGNARIEMKHGAGGRAMRTLIEELFVRGLAEQADQPSAAEGLVGGRRPTGGLADGEVGLSAMDDGAAFRLGDRFLVITTDSHVISPLFFPGGDIGRLAISGTVNDLAMMGATDVIGLSSAFVIEEGFARSELERVQASMLATCQEAGVRIVTGDTKVMGRGELDRLIINTTGVGLTERVVRDSGLRPGDRLIVTGTIGDHGLAVLGQRKNLGLEGELVSDVAPLGSLVRRALRAAEGAISAMKDPTRGGVASTLYEMATKSGVGIVIEEGAIPMSAPARAAAELLGIDPLHVANEGKALIGVRPEAAERVLTEIREHPLGKNAAVIGTCITEHRGSVILNTGFGKRLVSELEGEPLPRIC